VNAAYDSIAEWYDEKIRQRALLPADALIETSFFQAIGDVQGQFVCDLACGQGHMARGLARRGATAVGLDISVKLLDIARRDEVVEPLGIEYVHGDAENLPPLSLQPFDGVLCNLALMDIEDLNSALSGVARILREGGWFVATITHPCYSIPEGQSYFDECFWRSEYSGGVRGKVGARHRTLSTYLSALGRAGLLVAEAAEPQVPTRDVPPTLLLKCRHLTNPNSTSPVTEISSNRER
jgi:2-polyprenyl-3-methyl-5-hydroxy-6-metoxy-1,4-benzoquinol methylase